MQRLPLITSFIMFIALCASVAYWTMLALQPPQRAIAAPPMSLQSEPSLEAGSGLFGGRSSFAVASNFQLKGVVVASNPVESVALLAVNGKPAQAIRTNSQVVPGVTVKEIYKAYVLLSEGGVIKRVEMPENPKAQLKAGIPVATTAPPVPVQNSAGMLTNPIGAATQPVPQQMQADQSANATKAGTPKAALPDPTYGSSLLGKYYSERNAKLRKTPPPNR